MSCDRLGQAGPGQDHHDRHVAGLACRGTAQHPQPVVSRGRCPPRRAGVQVHGGGRVPDGVERAGVPAGPRADVLGHLAGEVEVKVGLAQGGLGDALDLLQHPRPEIGVGRGPRGDDLPRPGEPHARQVHVEADQVQGGRERGQDHGRDRLAEDEPGEHEDRDPDDPGAQPPRAWARARARSGGHPGDPPVRPAAPPPVRRTAGRREPPGRPGRPARRSGVPGRKSRPGTGRGAPGQAGAARRWPARAGRWAVSRLSRASTMRTTRSTFLPRVR